MLEANDNEAWRYEDDLPFSATIAQQVRTAIAQCDHVLVLLSDAACTSDWVAWELGYALELRSTRDERHPTILGVCCNDKNPRHRIQPRVLGSDQPFGPLLDFSAVRTHTMTNPEEIAQLVAQLSPMVTFIGRTDGHEGDLLRESFKCYERLFPEFAERDAPADIQTWIDEARVWPGQRVCEEIYAVLHMGELVVGMAYITAYQRCHLAFGNYFGVRRLWRSNNGSTAESFGAALDRRLIELDPQLRGLVWEVEPADRDLLAGAARRGRIGGHPDSQSVLRSVRQLRRINLYQQHGVRALLGADGNALPYWQPAMDDEMQPENMREMILMVRPFGDVNLAEIRLKELMDFVYGTLYFDAYCGTGTISIPGYRDYLAAIRSRVEHSAAHGWSLGQINYRREIRTLLDIARREDLINELDL
jgi:hypothetical protein